MALTLAIDCGSTNYKVALFDPELRRLASCTEPVCYTVRDAERVEFEPEGIWQSTVSLISQVCAKANVASRQITKVAIASQAQTFTLLDRDGRPVIPFLSWADKRAKAESAELREKIGEEFHQRCSFRQPIPQLQLSKLLWCSRRLDLKRLPALRVVSLPAFIALRMAGLHHCDSNIAAMSGVYSLAKGAWWAEAISAAGWTGGCFGEVVGPGATVPARARCSELNLSPDLHVIFAGNDQTVGAFANNARSQGLVLVLGTALVAYRFSGAIPGPFHPEGCWGPFPGGGFYELMTRDEGCSALDWALAQEKPGDEAGFFKLASGAGIGSKLKCAEDSCVPGVLFYPDRMHQANAWVGNGGPAERARAVLEGIAFSLRQMVDLMPGQERAGQVTVIGGGSVSSLWLEMLANVLNRPVSRGRGDILQGAAMLANPGVEPNLDREQVTFSPEPDLVAQYASVVREWQKRYFDELESV